MARWTRQQQFRLDGIIIRRTGSQYKALSRSGQTEHWYDLGDGTRCECPGFFYRQSCAHVTAVQKLIRRSPILGAVIRTVETRQRGRRVV